MFMIGSEKAFVSCNFDRKTFSALYFESTCAVKLCYNYFSLLKNEYSEILYDSLKTNIYTMYL
jgi:hypothetical protein